MNNINNVLLLLSACIVTVIICLIVLICVCKHIAKDIKETKNRQNYNEIAVRKIVQDFTEIKIAFKKIIDNHKED